MAVMTNTTMELILVCTAIGTAIGLFPVLRPYGERIPYKIGKNQLHWLALSYLALN